MRRTTAIAIATLALLAAGAGMASDAHAIAACTAAQISANDGASGRCPTGTGPCNIGKVFEIGDGCTLDFGTRAVTILGSGKLDILSNTVNLRRGRSRSRRAASSKAAATWPRLRATAAAPSRSRPRAP
jgi:hypothetical protein